MIDSNKFTGALSPMTESFQRQVVWAVGAILETDVHVKEAFHVIHTPSTGPLLFCLIPNANPKYHAQLAIGIDPDDLPKLFPAEKEQKMRLDALGEMANVVSGLLMSQQEFMDSFGHLVPSTPFFSEGAFTDRKDTGITGAVTANGKDILFHITVRPVSKPGWAGPVPGPAADRPSGAERTDG